MPWSWCLFTAIEHWLKQSWKAKFLLNIAKILSSKLQDIVSKISKFPWCVNLVTKYYRPTETRQLITPCKPCGFLDSEDALFHKLRSSCRMSIDLNRLKPLFSVISMSQFSSLLENWLSEWRLLGNMLLGWIPFKKCSIFLIITPFV